MTNSIRSHYPSSNSFRMIDWYLLVCNLFVFAALGEAALVGMTAPSKKFANQKGTKGESCGEKYPSKEKVWNLSCLKPTYSQTLREFFHSLKG